MRHSAYAQLFHEVLAEAGMLGVDPRHAEAWARSEYGTLDHLSRAALRRLVGEMREVLTLPEYRAINEQLAASYGV